MLRKKQKNNLIIALVVIVVLAIIAGLIAIYITTDMFKSNKNLFIKYLGKNTQNIETIIEMVSDESLSKYEKTSEITMGYTEKIGTTSENTNNIINNLKLTVDGKTDKEENYNYRNIKLQNADQDLINLEYLQQNNNYGLKFSDLYEAYLVSESGNPKELLKLAGVSDETLNKIPDTLLTTDLDALDRIKFNEDQIATLKNKYVKLIENSISNKKFKKQKNSTIMIDQKNVNVNAYTLTITKEELNTMYINILNELKQDEIILEKISYIQDVMDKLNILFDEPIDFQTTFVNNINKTIEEINKNNIGTEEIEISVYENMKQTVRTSIKADTYQINLDMLQSNEKYAAFTFEEKEEEQQKIEIKDSNNKLNVDITDNEKNYTINIERNKQENTNGFEEATTVTYKKADYKVDLKINSNVKKASYIEKKELLEENNSIKLESIDESQRTNLLNTVSQQVTSKIDEIKQSINMDDLQNVKLALGMAQDRSQLSSSVNITEIERNRFNSKFQLLNSEEQLDNQKMLEAIGIFENNIINLEIPSNTEIRVVIDRFESNEQYAENLKNYVKKTTNGQKYDVELQYDDETGLVKYIVIKIVKSN